MYELTYKKVFIGGKTIAAKARYKEAADADNHIDFCKKATRKNPAVDAVTGQKFYCTHIELTDSLNPAPVKKKRSARKAAPGKKTSKRGPRRKLTDDQIRDASELYWTTNMSADAIGKRYGVSGPTVTKYLESKRTVEKRLGYKIETPQRHSGTR